MRETTRIFSSLFHHFFRRFFDNDTVQADGDTLTTVVRALAIVAAPGLLVAFFLQTQYPRRDLSGRIEDQYFFVLLSFVVMGAVTVFEWEMLFPDRSDFLVLTPLPVGQLQVMAAKASALGCFMAMFLVSSNLLSAPMYAVMCKGAFFRQLMAQVLAVGFAGVFISMALLALGGLLRSTLNDRQFRVVSPILQGTVTTGLVLLVVQYARYIESVHALLLQPGRAHWLAPLWFLGLYDVLLYAAAAPPFATDLAVWAIWGTGLAALCAVIAYPGAWARARRMTLEGSTGRKRAPSALVSRAIGIAVRRPQQRAMFHFIGQTMRRTTRYQVYLAVYGGTGLAFALACSVVLRAQGASVLPALSSFGLHAVFPLLCFWLVAGLQTGFAFPVNLLARWVFRVAGSDKRDLAAAGKRWTLLATLALLCCTTLLVTLLGWHIRPLLVHVIGGGCLAVLLTDAFFYARTAPLTEPRMPGRSNFALLLTLYVGVLAPLLFGMVYAELRLEQSPWLLVPLFIATLALHLVTRWLQRAPLESEEEMEGYDGEFQLLNLR